MNIIAVDDEYHALKSMEYAILEALPDSKVSVFGEPGDVLAYAADNRIDVAFLDINMDGMNGLTIAERLKAINKKTNIIFVTGHAEYALNSYSIPASGYLMKPLESETITLAMSRLRDPLEDSTKAIKVKTLGPYTFDHVANRVYLGNCDALLKPKEFQLLCVFAGNPDVCFTSEELYQKVWGDDPNNSADNTVAVHISGIRKKLEMDDPNNPSIKKQRGEGYYLDIEE